MFAYVFRLCAKIMNLGKCCKKLHLDKVGAFCALYSVKIRVIVGVQFKRRKVDKKAKLHEK